MLVDLGTAIPVIELIGYYDWNKGVCVAPLVNTFEASYRSIQPVASSPDWEFCVRIVALAIFTFLGLFPIA